VQKTRIIWFGLLAFSLLATCPASEPAVVTDQELGQWAAMAQFVKATPQQRAALKQIYAAGNAVLQKYLKENGIAWGQAMHDAKSSVEETRKAGQTKVAQLQAGFDRLQAQQQRPLMAVLTPSQRLAWEEEQLRTAMIKVFLDAHSGP
jgi:Spy/CpxP family protein refolding chaperone